MTRTIAFVVHPGRADARQAAEWMETRLRENGTEVLYPQEGGQSRTCDMVFTFGGDGTLLSGARYALRWQCPLLGINMGTVGFLTEAEPVEMNEILSVVLAGTWQTESRGLLRVFPGEGTESFLALNDAVVTRGGFARLIQVETRINGEHWGTFIADGVIAATPTGSTGYSLSAGGPVIAPGVECIAVTPVCAHSLQHCPCIVPRDAEIIFHLRAERDQLAQLQIDGQNVCTLKAGDSIRITGAEETLKLARIGDYRYFHILQSKLSEWSKPREDEQE